MLRVKDLSESNLKLWEHYQIGKELTGLEQEYIKGLEGEYLKYQELNYLTDKVMQMIYPALYYEYVGKPNGEQLENHIDGIYPINMEEIGDYKYPSKVVVKSGMRYESSIGNGKIYVSPHTTLGEVSVYGEGGEEILLCIPEEVVYLGSALLHHHKRKWEEILLSRIDYLENSKKRYTGEEESIKEGFLYSIGYTQTNIYQYSQQSEERLLAEIAEVKEESEKLVGMGVQSKVIYEGELYERYLLLVSELNELVYG